MSRTLIIFTVTIFFQVNSFAGAFGLGSFENDDAFELLMFLEKETNTEFLARIFVAINRSNGYIEAPECSVAIAGAEVVAFSLNRRGANIPNEVADWIKTYSIKAVPTLSKLAGKAVKKCQTYENSELRQLVVDSEHMEEWSALMGDLRQRLK